MFCTDIFFLILTFMSYNYHFEGQNYNLSEFGGYVSQSQVIRSPLQAGQSWSQRAGRSSGRGLEKDRRTVPGRRQGLRIWTARGGHPSSLAGNLTNSASQEELCKIQQTGNLLNTTVLGLEKDPRTVPGRLQGLRIWPARDGQLSSLAGNLTNFASQAAGNVQNPPNGQFT